MHHLYDHNTVTKTLSVYFHCSLREVWIKTIFGLNFTWAMKQMTQTLADDIATTCSSTQTRFYPLVAISDNVLHGRHKTSSDILHLRMTGVNTITDNTNSVSATEVAGAVTDDQLM